MLRLLFQNFCLELRLFSEKAFYKSMIDGGW